MRLDVEKYLADLALDCVEHYASGNPDKVASWLRRVHEEHGERAAMREYLGGMTRLGAEVAACDDVRSVMGLDLR